MPLLACAPGPESTAFPTGESDSAHHADPSPLCQALAGRFLGLPREDDRRTSAASPPLAGRLWLQHCHVEAEGGTVRLALGGPAWYWLDREERGFRIRQPVALDVEARLAGEFGLESARGVASLYFRPTEEPNVSVRITNDVDVEPQTFWATILDALPFALVSGKARGRIHAEVASRFRGRLGAGATFTFDMRSWESDIALGRLPPGETPDHPFADGEPWLANERQLLYPESIHVVGPFEPASEMPLDVVVEQGSGLRYEAACARDVEQSIRAGARVPRLDPSVARISGRIEGAGRHRASLTLGDCDWCLVTTSAGETPSVVALRVRPGLE